jgi:hypothetical protein
MRKTLIGAITLVLALVATTAVLASPTAPPHLHGTVASVDAHAMSFAVKTTKDTETLQVNTATKFSVHGKTATFADLKDGDMVKVIYRAEGANKLATSVDVSTPPPAKKPAR